MKHIYDESLINVCDVITSRISPMPVTREFVADIKLFELLDHKKVFSKGYSCLIHCHTALEECEITEVLSFYKRKTKGGPKEIHEFPRFVKSQTYCRVIVTT